MSNFSNLSVFTWNHSKIASFLLKILSRHITDSNISFSGNKNLIWNIIDYSIVIILIIAAYYFTQDVLNDYKNKRSSMSFEKRAIQEQPSISISFDGDPGKTIWNRKMYKLGTEINITYYKALSTNYIMLKEGDNVSPDFGSEIINLRRMQSCYVINVKSENYKHEENLERSIRIDFSPHLAEPGKYLDAYLQIGSEPNSFGAEKATYKEGRVVRGLLWQDHFSNLIITTQCPRCQNGDSHRIFPKYTQK